MSENSETSDNSDNCQIFTCPICFKEQGSSSLEAFNKHVDACLDGSTISETSEIFSCTHESSTEISKQENVNHSFSLCKDQNYEMHQKIIGITSADGIQLVETIGNLSKAEMLDDVNHTHSMEECTELPSRSVNSEHYHQNASCTISLENEDTKSLSRQEPFQSYLHEVTNQPLVCPVCNLKQKTSDLTLFNVHVDVCLNKGIIQELRKDEVSPANQSKESNTNTGEFTVILKEIIFHRKLYLN